ncbi:MAG: hypothetical protein GY765_40130, partial [bacterium]|nr:hypothetical protein [bacterium]
MEQTLLERKLAGFPVYFSLYQKLKKWCADTWEAYKDVPEQISHDQTHSQRLMEHASTLLRDKLEPRSGTPFFQPEELFLLAAAIQLHDIGMQWGWKKFLRIPRSRGALTREDRTRIRKNHSETTADVIRSFREALPGSLEPDLTPKEKAVLCTDLNEALAFVCLCHNKPNLDVYLKKNLPDGCPDKTALLAALLQLCDTLHMDVSRLNLTRFRDEYDLWLREEAMEADYDAYEWKRFFQCYFIESVVLEPFEARTFRLRVGVRFNSDEKDAVKDKFLKIYQKRLTKTRHDCITVINREADLHLLNDYAFEILQPNSRKIKIDDRLLRLFDAGSQSAKQEPGKKEESPPEESAPHRNGESTQDEEQAKKAEGGRKLWRPAAFALSALLIVLVGILYLFPGRNSEAFVQGFVYSMYSHGEPVTGAQVTAVGFQDATCMTDINGFFKLKIAGREPGDRIALRVKKEELEVFYLAALNVVLTKENDQS